jgi:phosphatidylglycerophosphatase A
VSLIGVAPHSPLMALVAFAFFRFFDILKPGPVAWAERLPGAVGIMADDIVAGALAGLCTQGVWSLWSSVGA